MNRRAASPRLVGRRVELDALDEALSRAVRGEGSTVIVAGEAGIGKTRLLSSVADDATARGFVVLLGGCVELGDEGVPLAPVAEALRRLRDQVGPDRLVDLLGTTVPELGALVPGLVTDDSTIDAEPVPPGRLLELLLGLLEHLASTSPVLFVIEDLHWADRSTLDLLVFLGRNLRGPVVLLTSLRSDELHRRHPVRPVLAELIRSVAPVRVDLAPFTPRELADQIEAITGSAPHDDVLDALYRRCEGNPLFAEELLAAGAEAPEGLPSTLRDILMGRVSHLPESDQQTLRLAAAVGVRVDDRILRRIDDAPDDELDDSLRRLVDDNLLEPAPDGEGYCFRHALLQEIVYDELLPGERRRIHAEIAQELTNQSAGGAIAAAAVAHHWYRARNLPAALAASVEAGLAAERVPAPAEAVRHFERALELWDAVPDAPDLAPLDHVQLLAHAAEQENLTGDFARSIAHVRLALDLIDTDADPVTAGLLHERLGRFLWTADQDGLPDYVRALELVPAEPPSAERARVLAGYAQILMLNGGMTDSAAVAAEAVAIARDVGARQAEGHALNTLGTASIPLGRIDEGLESLQESARIAEEIGNLDDMARASVNLTHSLSILGRWDELLKVGTEGVEWARRVGQDRTCGVYVESNLLDALVATGAWDEAAERGGSLPSRLPVGYWEYFTAGSVLADRGDFVRAAEVAARLVAIPDVGTAMLQGLTDHVVGAMALAIWTGDPATARHHMETGLALIPDPFLIWRGGELFWRALWAEADLAARARAEQDVEAEGVARRMADDWFERVSNVAAGPLDGVEPSPSLLVHLNLCAAERARVDEADQPDDWQRAIDGVDDFGLRYQGAYARFRLVESLLRTGGDRNRAAAALDAARVTVAELGARPLAAEIDALARLSRLPLGAGRDEGDPGDQEDGEVDEGDDVGALGLSPRELQVLRLVAEGATNRQVAEQLFISPKTASVHVSNILAKLGVSSRGEAAAVAHRLGVTAES